MTLIPISNNRRNTASKLERFRNCESRLGLRGRACAILEHPADSTLHSAEAKRPASSDCSQGVLMVAGDHFYLEIVGFAN